ncbi:MAG: ribosomal protein L11 methyltransferase [Halieaceae bacterium]|jgi:ribosomal protein L11 methyltransferase
MTWLQLRLDTDSAAVESLEDLMLATGAVSVTLEDNADDPVLEPGVGETPLWRHTRLTGLYSADADMQAVLSQFPSEQLVAGNQRVEILEDKDWEREWMLHYRPMQFGQRLWVCPSWLEPPEPDAINLLLDPGLAFGTGTHPTTALCLTALEGLALQDSVIVDYGCGSGILAVAGCKLGAREVLGVDNDPQALAATIENARRNNMPDNAITVALPGAYDQTYWSQRADLVVANILAGPLIELSETLLDLLKPEGTLLLSGLLANQAEAISEHYRTTVPIIVTGVDQGWVCLSGIRPAQE